VAPEVQGIQLEIPVVAEEAPADPALWVKQAEPEAHWRAVALEAEAVTAELAQPLELLALAQLAELEALAILVPEVVLPVLLLREETEQHLARAEAEETALFLVVTVLLEQIWWLALLVPEEEAEGQLQMQRWVLVAMAVCMEPAEAEADMAAKARRVLLSSHTTALPRPKLNGLCLRIGIAQTTL